MRVLAVTQEASRTGSVRAFLDALPVLRELGSTLTVVNKSPGPLSADLAAASDKLLEVPGPWRSQLRRMARLRPLDRYVPMVERSIARSVVKEVRPDVLYASTVLSSEYAAVAQDLGIPVVLHVHEAQPLSGWALRRSGVDVRIVPMAAPSRYVADELKRMGAESVAVLPGPSRPADKAGGTIIDDLPWSAGSHRVVACGSVAPWKGTAEWLAAAEALPEIQGRRVEWTWVGAGDQLDGLRAETGRRALSDRMFWIGEREDARPYIASADLFVLPSRCEPLGLVVLEASSVGVASIAFSAGGVPEILVDERALALPGNIGDLVDKIRMALESPELRKALVDASRPALLESDLGTWRRHLADLVEAVAPSAALSAPSSGF